MEEQHEIDLTDMDAEAILKLLNAGDFDPPAQAPDTTPTTADTETTANPFSLGVLDFLNALPPDSGPPEESSSDKLLDQLPSLARPIDGLRESLAEIQHTVLAAAGVQKKTVDEELEELDSMLSLGEDQERASHSDAIDPTAASPTPPAAATYTSEPDPLQAQLDKLLNGDKTSPTVQQLAQGAEKSSKSIKEILDGFKKITGDKQKQERAGFLLRSKRDISIYLETISKLAFPNFEENQRIQILHDINTLKNRISDLLNQTSLTNDETDFIINGLKRLNHVASMTTSMTNSNDFEAIQDAIRFDIAHLEAERKSETNPARCDAIDSQIRRAKDNKITNITSQLEVNLLKLSKINPCNQPNDYRNLASRISKDLHHLRENSEDEKVKSFSKAFEAQLTQAQNKLATRSLQVKLLQSLSHPTDEIKKLWQIHVKGKETSKETSRKVVQNLLLSVGNLKPQEKETLLEQVKNKKGVVKTVNKADELIRDPGNKLRAACNTFINNLSFEGATNKATLKEELTTFLKGLKCFDDAQIQRYVEPLADDIVSSLEVKKINTTEKFSNEKASLQEKILDAIQPKYQLAKQKERNQAFPDQLAEVKAMIEKIDQPIKDYQNPNEVKLFSEKIVIANRILHDLEQTFPTKKYELQPLRKKLNDRVQAEQKALAEHRGLKQKAKDFIHEPKREARKVINTQIKGQKSAKETALGLLDEIMKDLGLNKPDKADTQNDQESSNQNNRRLPSIKAH